MDQTRPRGLLWPGRGHYYLRMLYEVIHSLVGKKARPAFAGRASIFASPRSETVITPPPQGGMSGSMPGPGYPQSMAAESRERLRPPGQSRLLEAGMTGHLSQYRSFGSCRQDVDSKFKVVKRYRLRVR